MMKLISFSNIKQALPLVSLPSGNQSDQLMSFKNKNLKEKVVLVLGATGTGKSRLSIHLANHFDGEIINSDKMQVYKGLDIVTNKLTKEEQCDIPHHLLGVVDPDADFMAHDFVHYASLATKEIIEKGKIPIIVGGSNSYIKALVHDNMEFRSKYECCFIWVDVEMRVLHAYLSKRVDKMVEAGLVDEVSNFWRPDGDYTRGIWRSIGVPEMHEYFEKQGFVDDNARTKILEEAIDDIKVNNVKLASCQFQKIFMLREMFECRMHHLDATEVFLMDSLRADEAWKNLVADFGINIVDQFLCKNVMHFVI